PGGDPGAGGFSLTSGQPQANCPVTDPELFGDVANAVPVGLHADDAGKVNDTGGTAKLLAVAPGVLEASPDPLLDKRPLEFRHRPDDLEHQAPRWGAQI